LTEPWRKQSVDQHLSWMQMKNPQKYIYTPNNGSWVNDRCDGGPTSLENFVTWDTCDIVYVHSVITQWQNSYGLNSQNTFFNKIKIKYCKLNPMACKKIIFHVLWNLPKVCKVNSIFKNIIMQSVTATEWKRKITWQWHICRCRKSTCHDPNPFLIKSISKLGIKKIFNLVKIMCKEAWCLDDI
jgi:hypothetical protein